MVTLTDLSGEVMQFPAYNDALEKYRFECRYMAFIDLDEFIYPKTNRSVVEVVDEILSADSNAAALAVNWQLFGSNGQEKADYSRGVLERFTRCASNEGVFIGKDNVRTGNTNVKTIANPRFIKDIFSAHFANYFAGKFAINSNGECVPEWSNDPPLTDKISINHYFVKSREEFFSKINKSSYRPDGGDKLNINGFSIYDRNEIFDDGILKYRAAREKNFSFESDEHRISRVINSLFRTLTQPFPEDAPPEFFVDKLETFLTCRAVAEKFQIKIGDYFAEEIALTKIYRLLTKINFWTQPDVLFFIEVLPEIISRPFPQAKNIQQLFSSRTLPVLIDIAKNSKAWSEYKIFRKMKRLIDSITL